MTAENILQRLDKVKRTGTYKWKACCPSHDSKSAASLAICEQDDGRVLLHCFGGCGAAEVLDALGLDWSALYPEKIVNGHVIKPMRKPWSASDVLQCLALESLVLLQFANKICRSEPLTDADRDRLLTAVTRFQSGERVANA